MKIKDTLGFVSLKYKTPSVCESCGGEFVCGANLKGCWCLEVKLSETARAGLKKKFERCLCRECLEKIASGE